MSQKRSIIIGIKRYILKKYFGVREILSDSKIFMRALELATTATVATV